MPAALRLLARREHSAAQLRRKLGQRGVDGAQAETVTQQLATRGWVDDQRYAEMQLRARTAQLHGPRRIRAELAVAGVATELVDAVFQAADTDWNALASRAWRRRYGAPATSPEERARQARYLLGRGFDLGTVSRVLQLSEDETDAQDPD